MGVRDARRARARAVTIALTISLIVAALLTGCAPAEDVELVPRSTLFIGVDVSGSFEDGGRYDDAIAFAAHYIRAHLTGAGGLEEPRALFVAAIGGERPGQPQAFRPIHDFEGKPVAEIEADLRVWFPPEHDYTDFSAFFRRAATLVTRRNLTLAPITFVLLTDGVPDTGRASTGAGAGQPGEAGSSPYATIDLDPLEYLARNVTVRVLYPDPAVAVRWEQEVPRNRVRMWTVDAVVMGGWRDQLRSAAAAAELALPGPDSASVQRAGALPATAAGELVGDQGAPEAQGAIIPRDQPDLWRWIGDNVDFRVRRSVL